MKMSRFDYVKYDLQAEAKQIEFKQAAERLEKQILLILPVGRAQSLALTSLEEMFMWVGKAIRDDQISRNANGSFNGA